MRPTLATGSVILLVLSAALPVTADPPGNFAMRYDTFSTGIHGWYGVGNGTLDARVDTFTNTQYLHIARADPAFWVRSPGLGSVEALTMHLRAPSGGEPAILELNGRAVENGTFLDKTFGALRLTGYDLQYVAGDINGPHSWRRVASWDPSWHRVDLVVSPTSYTVALDQGTPVTVPKPTTFGLSDVVVRPGAAGVSIERFVATRYQVDAEDTFTGNGRGVRVVETGQAATWVGTAFDVGFTSRGLMTITSSRGADTLAYAGAMASNARDHVVTAATRFPSITEAARADHPALIAGLDNDGDVIWAVTHGAPIGLSGAGSGLWFWGPNGVPQPLTPLVPEDDFSPGWRSIHAFVYTGHEQLAFLVDDEWVPGVFRVEDLERVVEYGAGDVWKGRFPSGSADMWIDEVAVYPLTATS